VSGKRIPKHNPDNLISALRIAAEARAKIRAVGVDDNGGAIHSVERILDILGQRLKYPRLSHINKLKNYANAEMSIAAFEQIKLGGKVEIEHVAQKRALSISMLGFLETSRTDSEIKCFVDKHYRLVLLTPTERQNLDKINRTKLDPDRLAGIEMRISN
jgi:hypothetical protein